MAAVADITHISELHFDSDNPRKHNPRNIGMTAESLQQFGPMRSIVIDETNTILAGNGVIEAAAQVGIEGVRVFDAASGTLGPEPPGGAPYILAVRRSDLTPEAKQQYKVADNRTAELAEWDDAVLQAMIARGESPDDWFTAAELASAANLDELDDTYAAMVETPLYTPTQPEPPPVADLMETSRADTLQAAIDAADIPSDVRAFLTAAATRHIVFDYRNIAEFYAHADPDVQRLMEESALVIIDFHRAIELGYATLRRGMLDQIEAEDDDA